ncbi:MULTISPECIES: hypothetical protein, partial [unclassified Photorhabdus]|uniref:hypothetical protein n=1 Tax=unclassified Photorhabdus TaxID=2620880 RepID=UPI00195F28EE
WSNNVIVGHQAKEISLRKPAGVMITVQKFSLAEYQTKYARALLNYLRHNLPILTIGGLLMLI